VCGVHDAQDAEPGMSEEMGCDVARPHAWASAVADALAMWQRIFTESFSRVLYLHIVSLFCQLRYLCFTAFSYLVCSRFVIAVRDTRWMSLGLTGSCIREQQTLGFMAEYGNNFRG
jgi:hypothetical protein